MSATVFLQAPVSFLHLFLGDFLKNFLPEKQLNSKSQVTPHLFAEHKLVNFGNAK